MARREPVLLVSVAIAAATLIAPSAAPAQQAGLSAELGAGSGAGAVFGNPHSGLFGHLAAFSATVAGVSESGPDASQDSSGCAAVFDPALGIADVGCGPLDVMVQPDLSAAAVTGAFDSTLISVEDGAVLGHSKLAVGARFTGAGNPRPGAAADSEFRAGEGLRFRLAGTADIARDAAPDGEVISATLGMATPTEGSRGILLHGVGLSAGGFARG